MSKYERLTFFLLLSSLKDNWLCDWEMMAFYVYNVYTIKIYDSAQGMDLV